MVGIPGHAHPRSAGFIPADRPRGLARSVRGSLPYPTSRPYDRSAFPDQAERPIVSGPRQEFGLESLDKHLGGGLLPGTLTVVAGAAGAGKPQLGLTWANRGLEADGRRGVVCDLTSRGDAQNHAGYAQALFDWAMHEYPSEGNVDLARVWDLAGPFGDYFHPFA